MKVVAEEEITTAIDNDQIISTITQTMEDF